MSAFLPYFSIGLCEAMEGEQASDLDVHEVLAARE